MLFNIYCEKHPRYQGIREPKGGIISGCMACVRLFLDKKSYRNGSIYISHIDGSRLKKKTFRKKSNKNRLNTEYSKGYLAGYYVDR